MWIVSYSTVTLPLFLTQGHPMLKILCFSKSQISEILRFSIVESHSLSLFSAKNRECLHFPTSPILRFSSEFLPFYFSFHFFHFLIALEAFKNNKTHTFSTLLCFLSRNDVVLRPFQPTNSPTCWRCRWLFIIRRRKWNICWGRCFCCRITSLGNDVSHRDLFPLESDEDKGPAAYVQVQKISFESLRKASFCSCKELVQGHVHESPACGMILRLLVVSRSICCNITQIIMLCYCSAIVHNLVPMLFHVLFHQLTLSYVSFPLCFAVHLPSTFATAW